MISRLFLGISLVGAESVLYFLILLSVLSVGLILERVWFYRRASKGLIEFRQNIRRAAENGRWEDVTRYTEERRSRSHGASPFDMDTRIVSAMIGSRAASHPHPSSKSLEDLAQDGIIQARLLWEQNLVILATIGSNAPFVGLFGTVLGIIKAFHSLSEQAGSGVPTVTAGISEALVATAAGILVAIPAVVAFNLFQRRIRSALSEAEALKSFLAAKLSV